MTDVAWHLLLVRSLATADKHHVKYFRYNNDKSINFYYILHASYVRTTTETR